MGSATVHISKIFEYTFMKLGYTILGTLWLLWQITLVVRFVLWVAGIWQPLDRWLPLGRFAQNWVLVSCLMGLIPYKPLTPSETSFWHKGITSSGLMVFGMFHWGMSWLCERCPWIAKALPLDRRPWDFAKIEHLPPMHRTGYEEETGVIHTLAWSSFVIFLSNLGICVLWYAFVYDSTGTLNPRWTDVFG